LAAYRQLDTLEMRSDLTPEAPDRLLDVDEAANGPRHLPLARYAELAANLPSANPPALGGHTRGVARQWK
jgi:hypothetical protein